MFEMNFMKDRSYPKIGVGVIVKRGDKILMGLRKGAHGEGTWSFPGGHLEFNETFDCCTRREVKEETGLEVRETKFVTATNDIMTDDRKHYVTIFMEAIVNGGEPEVCEPDKCERWQWFHPDQMPENIFVPIINLKKLGHNF